MWSDVKVALGNTKRLAILACFTISACATHVDEALSESGAPPPSLLASAETSASPSALSQQPGPRNKGVIYLGTFNIQNFGKTKAGRPDVMKRLAEIVRRHDVIAIQEISDKTEEAPAILLDYINRNGAQYAYVLSARSGREPDDTPSQEQYAIYYDTGSLSLERNLDLYDDSTHDRFQREPQVVKFRTLGGDFQFVIVNIHTRPESAIEEIDALDDVARWIARKLGDVAVIMVGDFNGGCSYASPDELDALAIRGQKYTWVVPDTADSNLSTKRCAYDRIVLTEDARYTGKWSVWSAFESKEISDHWPVWASFNIDE